MSAHTPGPWRVDAHRQVVTVEYSERTGLSKLIAPTHDGMPREEQEANARLIAAAPEMLALLQELITLDSRAVDDADAAHAFNAMAYKGRALLARLA